MKDVLTVFTFSMTALSFVIFLAVFKPADLSVAASVSKHATCNAAAVALGVCSPQVWQEASTGTLPRN